MIPASDHMLHPPVTQELTADEIRWDLQPPDPKPADVQHPLTAAIIEAESYRALAVQAIHELADLRSRHVRLRNQHHRLLDELRRRRGAA